MMADLKHTTKEDLQRRLDEALESVKLWREDCKSADSVNRILKRRNAELEENLSRAEDTITNQAAALGLMARNWPVPGVLSTAEMKEN
jgi:hypothetical protein